MNEAEHVDFTDILLFGAEYNFSIKSVGLNKTKFSNEINVKTSNSYFFIKQLYFVLSFIMFDISIRFGYC